jgi:hypothetical protein
MYEFQATRDKDPQYIEQLDRDSKMLDTNNIRLISVHGPKQFNENNK